MPSPQLFVLVVGLFACAINAQQCYCPSGMCSMYDGSEANCFCWAQMTANQMKQTGRVSYFPSGQFSSGGCTYCPSGPANGQEVFWLHVGYCAGGSNMNGVCNPYGGSQLSCENWCQQTAQGLHFNGQYTCQYIPFGEFSTGGCSVSGYQNPCTVNADANLVVN